jgi:hypothetical protein
MCLGRQANIAYAGQVTGAAPPTKALLVSMQYPHGARWLVAHAFKASVVTMRNHAVGWLATEKKAKQCLSPTVVTLCATMVWDRPQRHANVNNIGPPNKSKQKQSCWEFNSCRGHLTLVSGSANYNDCASSHRHKTLYLELATTAQTQPHLSVFGNCSKPAQTKA